MSTGSVPIGERPALRRRALKDVAIQVAARIGNLALGVVVTALLARSLGDVGFGQWMTILTTFQLVGVFTTLGLDQAAMREAARHPDETHVWIGALVVARVALTVPSMVVAVIALLVLRDGDAMLVAGLFLLVQFPFSIASSLQLVHQLRMRNSFPMLVLTVNSVVWGVCVVVINVTGGGLVALAVGLAGTTALTASMQAAASLRLLGSRLRAPRPAILNLIRVGAPLGVAGILVNAYARIDQVIVYEQAGASAAGLYGSVYRVLEQAHFVPVSLLTTLAPVIAALWLDDRERMLRVVGLTARLLTIGSLGALAFVVVAAKPVVRLIFGEEFVPGAQALPVLGGAFVFICFGYLVGNLLLVMGLARMQIVVGLVGLVVNVVGNLLLVPPYGYMGAAWMTLVTEAAVVGTGAWFVIRNLGVKRLDPMPLLRVAAAAAILGGTLAACCALGAPFAVLIIVAVVTYPALLLLARAISPVELRETVALRGSAG